MRRHATRASAVAVAAALTLAACAQGTSQEPEEAAGADGNGGDQGPSFDPEAELSGSMELMGFGLGDDVATSRWDIAQEALGDVQIDHIEGGLDIQQFLTAVASGSPPDLIYATREQIGAFASRGAIMPLSQCIEGEGIEIDSFKENALVQVTFDGEVYGIPEFNTVQITQANADLLDQSGLTLDDVNGSDWDALTAATEELMQREGDELTVIGYDSKLPEFLPLWARSNGVDLISDDARTAQLNDPAVIEALEYALSLYEMQGGFGTVKAVRDSTDFFGEGNQFATGTLGAMPMEHWYLNVLNDVTPDAPMAFDAYRGKDGEPMAYAGGNAWAITADSQNPEAACRFARSMTEVDTWVAAAENRISLREEEGGIFTGILTGNRVADEEVRAMVESTGDEVWDSGIEAMYNANDYAFNYPASPADAEFKTAWEDAVNRVLNDQEDVQTAMDRAQEEAQAALDDAWAVWDDEG